MRSSIALGFWSEAGPDAAGSKGQGMVIDEQRGSWLNFSS
jgi:hypothetical protein